MPVQQPNHMAVKQRLAPRVHQAQIQNQVAMCLGPWQKGSFTPDIHCFLSLHTWRCNALILSLLGRQTRVVSPCKISRKTEMMNCVWFEEWSPKYRCEEL